jgi:hypothetical protein
MIVREAEAQKQLYEEGVAVPRPEPGSLPGSAPHPGSGLQTRTVMNQLLQASTCLFGGIAIYTLGIG